MYVVSFETCSMPKGRRRRVEGGRGLGGGEAEIVLIKRGCSKRRDKGGGEK